MNNVNNIGIYSLTAGTAAAFFQSGLFTSSSILAVPAILSAPTPSAVQTGWRVMFGIGKIAASSLGIFSTTCFAISAGAAAYEGRDWKAEAGGTAFAAAFIPWTLIVMANANNSLLGDKLKETAIKSVVNEWYKLNLIRAVLPFTAGAIGLSILTK